ncbi:hypothetical protein D9M68_619230 [compost metagenome]
MEPFGGMGFARADQFFRQLHARTPGHQRIAAHAREQVERNFREAHAGSVLSQHEVMGQRGFEAAAQRRAFDHRERDRAGVETARGGMHAIHAGPRIGPQGLALAGADGFGEEVEIAADVVDLRNQRARDPEVDGQAGVLGGARQVHDFVYQFMVKAWARLRPEHHPHDSTSLLVKRGNLLQIARCGEGVAVRMNELIHLLSSNRSR